MLAQKEVDLGLMDSAFISEMRQQLSVNFLRPPNILRPATLLPFVNDDEHLGN
jgi:hypothetical protein